MKVTIDYERALERHPELVQSALDELEQKRPKKYRRPVNLDEVVWSYQWSVAVNAVTPGVPSATRGKLSNDVLDRCYVSLCVKDARLEVSVALAGQRSEPTPREQLPPEIVDEYERLNRLATEEDTPHIVSFDTVDVGKNTKALVIAGARDNKGLEVLFTHHVGRREAGVFFMYESKDGAGFNFKGFPRGTFRDRLMNAEVGDEFTYMNKRYTRLSEEEIIERITPPTAGPKM